MDGNRFCSICVKTPATTFCICSQSQSGPTLLCDSHLSEHLVKDRSRLHQLLPIGAVSEQISPGYCERLKNRQDGIQLGKELLMENVKRIDRCIEEFAGKVQEVMNVLSAYWTEQNSGLLKLREEMVTAINEAIAEAEATLYQDAPTLHCQLAEPLRAALHHQSNLRLFDYYLDQSPYPSSLETLLILQNRLNMTNIPTLPVIMDSNLTLFNLSTTTKQTEMKHLNLQVVNNDQGTLCVISPTQYFNVFMHKALVLDMDLRQILQKQHTIKGRLFAGSVKFGNFVYVFGGVGEKSAERYDLALNKWQPLPEMQQEMWKFTPAVHESCAYLVNTSGPSGRTPCANTCGFCHEESGYMQGAAQMRSPGLGVGAPVQVTAVRCEKFSFETREFQTLNVTLQWHGISTGSVSFVNSGKLFLFSESGDWYSWTIDSEETGFTVPQVKVEESGFRSEQGAYSNYRQISVTSCAPVCYQGRFYWVNQAIGQIATFDPTNSSLLYRSL